MAINANEAIRDAMVKTLADPKVQQDITAIMGMSKSQLRNAALQAGITSKELEFAEKVLAKEKSTQKTLDGGEIKPLPKNRSFVAIVCRFPDKPCGSCFYHHESKRMCRMTEHKKRTGLHCRYDKDISDGYGVPKKYKRKNGKN